MESAGRGRGESVASLDEARWKTRGHPARQRGGTGGENRQRKSGRQNRRTRRQASRSCVGLGKTAADSRPAAPGRNGAKWRTAVRTSRKSRRTAELCQRRGNDSAF